MKILHPDNAKVIEAPENMPDCQPLPVVIEPDGMASFWQPEPIEIEALQRGGSVFLKVRSNVHPVVQIGVVEYPGTLATDPYDEALERAANSTRFSASPYANDADREAFKAGARWQAARPMEITLEPLVWFNPEPHISVCRDDVTHQTFILSEHNGAVYFGSHEMDEFKSDKTIEELKEALQMTRNARIMSAINFKALAS